MATMNGKKDSSRSHAAIGKRLALARTVVGTNQEDFAGKAGIAQNTYNQYERGKKRPSIDNAMKLCDTYLLTLDWIYMGDPSGLPYRLADSLRDLGSSQ